MIKKNISTLIKHDNEYLYKAGSFTVSNKSNSNSKIEISNKVHSVNQPFPMIKTGFRKLNAKIYSDSISYTNNVVHLRVLYPFSSFTVFANSFANPINYDANTIMSLFENSPQQRVNHPNNYSFYSIELHIINPNQYTYVYIKSDNFIDDQLILIS